MPTEVEVAGLGIVEFPDQMSPEDITNVLKSQFAPKPYSPPTAVPEPPRATNYPPLADQMKVEDRAAQMQAIQDGYTPEKLAASVYTAPISARQGLKRTLAGVTRWLPDAVIPRGLSKAAADALSKSAEKNEAEIAQIREQLGKSPAVTLPHDVVSTGFQSLPPLAAGPLGIGAIAAAAGAQTFGSVTEEAYQKYLKEGSLPDKALLRSLPPAVASGLVTGLLTRFMPGGAERGIIEALKAGGGVTTVKAAIKSALSKVPKEALQEFPEEGLDQLAQGFIAQHSYDPEKTTPEILKESLVAGLTGSFLAGAITTAKAPLDVIRGRQSRLEPQKPTIARMPPPVPTPVEPTEVPPVRDFPRVEPTVKESLPVAPEAPPQAPSTPAKPAEPEYIEKKAFKDSAGKVHIVPGRLHAAAMFPEVAASMGTTPEAIMEMEPGYVTTTGRYVSPAQVDEEGLKELPRAKVAESTPPQKAPITPVEPPKRPVEASEPQKPTEIPPEAPKGQGEVKEPFTVSEIQAQQTKVDGLRKKLNRQSKGRDSGFLPPPIRNETSAALGTAEAKLGEMRTAYRTYWDQRNASNIAAAEAPEPATTPQQRPVTSGVPPAAPAPEGEQTVAQPKKYPKVGAEGSLMDIPVVLADTKTDENGVRYEIWNAQGRDKRTLVRVLDTESEGDSLVSLKAYATFDQAAKDYADALKVVGLEPSGTVIAKPLPPAVKPTPRKPRESRLEPKGVSVQREAAPDLKARKAATQKAKEIKGSLVEQAQAALDEVVAESKVTVEAVGDQGIYSIAHGNGKDTTVAEITQEGDKVKVHRIGEGTFTVPTMEDAIRKLKELYAGTTGAPTVTFEVDSPKGKGTYTVKRNGKALSEFLKKAKTLATDSVKPQSQLTPKTTAKLALTPEMEAWKTRAEALAKKLEALKAKGVNFDPTVIGVALWNSAVNLAQETIRAGGTIADAVTKAVAYIKANYKGTWDEADARKDLENLSEQESLKKELEESGDVEAEPATPPLVPEATKTPQVQVHGENVGVKDKRLLSADAGRTFALDQFRAAGLDVEIGPDNRVHLKDESTPGQNDKGQKLLELTRNINRTLFDMALKGSPDNDLGANFLDSVRMLAVRMLSEKRSGNPTAIDDTNLLNDLFQSGHQGIRQWGQALQAVGVRGKEFETRMAYIDSELMGWLSDRFGGTPDPDSVEPKDRKPDGAGTIVRDVVKEVTEETKKTPNDPKGAAKRALETVQGKLTEEQKGYAGPKTPLWKTIEKAILEGERDDYNILRKIAAKYGANPSDADIARMKAMVKRIQQMRKLTPKQLEKLAKEGVTAEMIQRYDETGAGLNKDQEAALAAARSNLKSNKATIDKLHVDMVSLWAKMTKPIHWKSVETRRNFIRAMNEFAPLNTLFRLAFTTVQGMDILTQGVLHNFTASMAQATRRLNGLDEKGIIPWTAEFAKALGDGVKYQFKSTRSGWNAFKLGMRERKGLNVGTEGIDAHMHIMERAMMAAEENWAKGDPVSKAKAMAQWLFSRIELGIRFAKSMDAFQTSSQQLPELVGMVKTWLINNTDMNRGEVATYTDEIVGDVKDELAYARSIAPDILFANGEENPSTARLNVAAWNVVFERILERARQSKLGPAQVGMMESEIRHRMMTLGWNLPEDSNIGKMIRTPLKSIENALVKAYIPSGSLTMFGNAIANSVVQGSQWMGLGLRPDWFSGSPTVKSDLDRTQTKWKGAVGLAVGMPLLYAIAQGLLPYWRKWPDDEEERAKMEAYGFKPGTVYIPTGNGSYFGISGSAGPFALLRTFTAAGSGIRDMALKHQRAQERMNAQAAKLGIQPGVAPGWTAREVLGVVAGTMLESLQGSRVASGKIGQFTDYGQLVGNKTVASYMGPFLPAVPMYQNMAGLAGIELNPKLASVDELLFPTTNGPRRVNVFGEPATEIGDMENILRRLTRGSGDIVDEPKNTPYASLFTSGYMPPAMQPNKGYNINGQYRPMTGNEFDQYAKVRGEEFFNEMQSVGFTSDPEVAGKAFRTANRRALTRMGVRFPKPKRQRPIRSRRLSSPRLRYRSTRLRSRRRSRY